VPAKENSWHLLATDKQQKSLPQCASPPQSYGNGTQAMPSMILKNLKNITPMLQTKAPCIQQEQTMVPEAMLTQNLLAILNALVHLLRTQCLSITPHDFLAALDSFIKSRGHPQGQDQQ
jgi:hypothetical protein